MATNGGTKKLSVEANVHGLDTVWYDASTLANILSLELLRKKYRVTYDSDVANTFFVHTEKGIIEFIGQDGLYAFRPSKAFFEWVSEQKGMMPDRSYAQDYDDTDSDSDSDSDDDISMPGLVDSICDDSSVESESSAPPMIDRDASDDEREDDDRPRWVNGPPEHVSYVISTVEEQRHGLTERQFQRAVRARHL